MTNSDKMAGRQLDAIETRRLADQVALTHSIRLVARGSLRGLLTCGCGRSFSGEPLVQMEQATAHFNSALATEALRRGFVLAPEWTETPEAREPAPEPFVAPPNAMPESVRGGWVAPGHTLNPKRVFEVGLAPDERPFVLGPEWRAVPLWAIKDAVRFIEAVGDSAFLDFPGQLVSFLHSAIDGVNPADDLTPPIMVVGNDPRIIIEPKGANRENVKDVAAWVGRERDEMKSGAAWQFGRAYVQNIDLIHRALQLYGETLPPRVIDIWTLTLEAENDGIVTTIHATGAEAEEAIRDRLSDGAKAEQLAHLNSLGGASLMEAWTEARGGRCIAARHRVRWSEATLEVLDTETAAPAGDVRQLVSDLAALLKVGSYQVRVGAAVMARAEAYLQHGDENLREVDAADGMNENLWRILQELLTAVNELPGVRDKIDCYMRGRGTDDPPAEIEALHKAAF